MLHIGSKGTDQLCSGPNRHEVRGVKTQEPGGNHGGWGGPRKMHIHSRDHVHFGGQAEGGMSSESKLCEPAALSRGLVPEPSG